MDPVQELRRKVARKDELIAKWAAAAAACDDADAVGRATKTYCLGLARDAREKKARLQAEIAQLGGQARADRGLDS
jgi:hypothetical protein